MLGIHADASGECRSICSISQVAFATAHPDSFQDMDEADLFLWRIERLQAGIDRVTNGNLNAFGLKMEYKDGSYIGQMLRGQRAITEKFVRKFEEVTGLVGWFDPDTQHDSMEYQLRTELLQREVPEHVLQTFLETVRHYPARRKAG